MNFKLVLDKSKRKSEVKITLDNIVEKNHDIDDTDIDGEKVMMNLDKGQYFMINEVGSKIWDMIDKHMKVIDIIGTLFEEYEVDKKECEEKVLEFLENLYKEDLISVN